MLDIKGTKFAIDLLQTHKKSVIKSWNNFGLVCNQASVDYRLHNSWEFFFQEFPNQFKVIFGPQHGFESTVQDNMIETAHAVHTPTGLPVYSLYSQTREPTSEMLNNIDTIVVDLQISGSRVYTYKYTMAACLRAAQKNKKKVVVLDRPNPLGGENIAGRVLELDVKSFVGEFSIPMQHGLTMGELATLFNKSIGAELEVITMESWNTANLWSELNRRWILPSPNIPIVDCFYTFPGTVMLEGTNISEGRGTCLPFLLIGAPYIKDSIQFSKQIYSYCQSFKDQIYLRPTEFMPAFQKWTGKVCRGVQIHIIDPQRFNSYKLGVAIIKSALQLSNNEFEWKQPGYEYNFVESPINLIGGSKTFKDALLSDSIDSDYWSVGLKEIIHEFSSILLYPRTQKILK